MRLCTLAPLRSLFFPAFLTFLPLPVYNACRARVAPRALAMMMSALKTLLSKLWKITPRGLRWRAMWLISPRYVVGVTGVVFNNRGEVLLAHHVFRDGIAWGLPGGAIQYGEPLEHAVHREILEETGISVEVGPLLQVTMHPEWPNLTCHFLCAVDGMPQAQVSGELFEAGFYALDVLPGTIAPGQQEIIDRGLRIRGGAEDWPIEVL